MSLVGYARVSTADQSLDIQLSELAKAGCAKVFSEQKSGRVLRDRSELERCINYVRQGDVLVVTRLDRLARSILDFNKLLAELQSKGVEFRCLQQPFDTTSPTGKLMMQLLAAFAEFEVTVAKERQREGIERARAAGKYTDPKTGNKVSRQKWGGVFRALKRGVSYMGVAKSTGIPVDTIRLRYPDFNRNDYPLARRQALAAKDAPAIIPAWAQGAPYTPSSSAGEPVEAEPTPQTPVKSTSLLGRFFKSA